MLHALPKRPTTVLPPHPSNSSRLQFPQQSIPNRPVFHNNHTQPSVSNPPPLTLASTVLLSQLPLPPNPVIAYRQLGATDGVSNPLNAVEQVRQQLVSEWENTSQLLDSILVTVRIDRSSVSLWLFAIASDAQPIPPLFQRLDSLYFDSLHGIRAGRFSPRDIFPCSPDCSHPSKACEKCYQEPPQIQVNYPTSVLLPRPALQQPYAAFLDACRARLIDKVVSQQQPQPSLPLFKLNDGFIYASPTPSHQWSANWDHQQRPMVHCHLHLSLLADRILIHPIFRSSPFHPLPPHPSPGTPVVLVPHAAPAHYIGPYTGRKDHLTNEFRYSLAGLGCRNWETEEFVVCWLSVRSTRDNQLTNPQVEERGFPIVWPRRLCLRTTSPSRSPLSSIPSIPPSICLPPSPPSKTSAETPLTAVPSTLTTSTVPPEPQPATTARHSTKSLLRAFKALAVDAHQNISSIAADTSSFVDEVVKERAKYQQKRDIDTRNREKELQEREKEKERERMRGIINPTSSRSKLGFSTDASTFNPLPVVKQPIIVQPVPPTASNPQGFYPSPPEFYFPGMPSSHAGPSEPPANHPSPATNAQHLLDTATVKESLSSDSSSDDLVNFPQLADNRSLDISHTMVTAFASDVPFGSSTGALMGMGMNVDEDFTEDDFNFFDDPTAPPNPQQTDALSLHEFSHSFPNSDDPTQELWLPQFTPLNDPTPNAQDDHPPTHPAASEPSALPISPAQTSPSPHASPLFSPRSLDGDVPPVPAVVNPQPPEFPFRTKEYVSKAYEAIPFPASDYATDQKYILPGGKFSMVKLPPSPTPSLTEDESERDDTTETSRTQSAAQSPPHVPPTFVLQSTSTFIPAYIPPQPKRRPPRSLHRPSKRRQAEAEAARAKRREQQRLEKVEIWHSTVFSDKFAFMTDPRVQHIRRLRGTKRHPDFNSKPHTRDLHDMNQRGTWMRTNEFADIIPPIDLSETDSETETETDDGSESDSGTERGAGDEDVIVRSEDSRPLWTDRDMRTPPPTEALLGASLLHTQFQPTHVLAYALQHPSSSAQGQTPTSTGTPSHPPQPTSVPTPVSPAAHFASGEGASIHEAAAHVMTREVIENPIWSESFSAWFGLPKLPTPVWPSEVHVMAGLLQNVLGPRARSTLQRVIECGAPFSYVNQRAKPFIPPSKTSFVSLGHAGSVVHVSSPAMRFWEKLGLTPLSGRKNVVAFALFEERDDSLKNREMILKWMHQVSTIYAARGLGDHTIGTPGLGSFAEGLVPFKWESVKKVINILAASLPQGIANVILYLVTTPSSSVTSFVPFRHLSAVIKRIQGRPLLLDERFSFHFVPRDVIFEPQVYPYFRHLGVEHFVLSAYDRLLRKVDRDLPRELFKHDLLAQPRFLQAPAFTLTRESTPNFAFILLDWPPPSINAADRHTLLQAGYQLSEDKEWLFLAYIDERGEAHDTMIWYMKGQCDEDELNDRVVTRVLSFVLKFATSVNTEWNVVITRLGTMTEPELQAWEKCLQRDIANETAALHVTIACYETEVPLAFVASGDSKEVTQSSLPIPRLHSAKGTVQPFYDVSSNTYILLPWHRTPLSAPSTQLWGYDSLSVSKDTAFAGPDNSATSGLLPLSSAYFFHTPHLGDLSASSKPASSDLTRSISSTQLHLLHSTQSPTSSFRKPLHALRRDIAKSFVSLSLLTKTRFDLTLYGALPFHLAAVEMMRSVILRTNEAPV